MQPTLKEDPREWRKFAVVLSIFLAGLAILLWHRRSISNPVFGWMLALSIAGLASGFVHPPLWRPIYRGVMTVSFYWGQLMGRILLVLLFLLIVTPLALILRLLGKDFLRLKRNLSVPSYWLPAKQNDDFDRQF